MRIITDSEMFKRCQVCNRTWITRLEFLEDATLHLAGYQVDFEELVAGLFLFNHACGATLATPAAAFRDLRWSSILGTTHRHERLPRALPARERLGSVPGTLRMRLR